jgi:hypothetical protein
LTQRASVTHAVDCFEASYTYGWLDERSDALAVWLAQACHVARRGHVAILLQNVPDFIVAVLAFWKLGARAGIVAAGLSPRTPIITLCPRAHQGRDDMRVIPAGVIIDKLPYSVRRWSRLGGKVSWLPGINSGPGVSRVDPLVCPLAPVVYMPQHDDAIHRDHREDRDGYRECYARQSSASSR